jgi:hypothetical protein
MKQKYGKRRNPFEPGTKAQAASRRTETFKAHHANAHAVGLVYFFGIFIPKDVGICGDLVFTQYPQILFPKNTLP